MDADNHNTKRYVVYASGRRIGAISFDGKVTTADEGISGIDALKTLLKVFPRGFYVKPEESGFRRFWRRGG